MRWIAPLIPAVLLLSLASAKKLNLAATPETRLPENVVPTHYSLDLYVDPDSTGFNGYVDIYITATNANDGIVKLHAAPKDLTLEVVLLDYGKSCSITDINEDTDIVTLACPQNSLNGQHILTIQYQGKYTDDMHGFYKSVYEENGTEYVLVATQFESRYARRAFPCFDEPSFKATFQAFLTHPHEYTVLSNTPVIQEYIVASGYQTEFKTTPEMSTYLLAFVVSKFVPNGEVDGPNYEFKVYARPEEKDFTSVAATNGPILIDLLSQWTQINYADLGNEQAYLVAIPDFAAGAMENWGLVTFREVDLLDEGDRTPKSFKQRIITTVAHELSHMWFGDYVTLDWWSDTWLNEGFATYFEFHIPDLIENEHYETAKQFVTSVLQSALQDDAVPSSNALTSDNSKFDGISYDKGGSIVRMIKHILGENTFRAGLHTYLATNHHQNTNPTLLLEALQTAAGTTLDVARVLTNWIYKAGFPLLTVTLNEEGTSVEVTQERFLLVENSSVEATEWHVPISYTTSDEKNFGVAIKTWLEPSSTVNINVSADSWIIFNIQQSGFYRVNYDDKLWDRIIAVLNNETERAEIDVLNRAQLIDDVFNIARVGKTGYENAFRLLETLNYETDHYPWVSAFNAISYILGKLDDTETVALLQNRILSLINSAFPDITQTGTSHVDVLKGVQIWDWACKLGHEDCINYAKTTFENYKTTNSLPDYDKRGVVFCHALRNSENAGADYEFLFNIFRNSKFSVEQNVIINSLGCASDPEVLLQYLSETIATNSAVRKQDAVYVFRAVYGTSDTGVDASLTFLENNLPKLIETYPGTGDLSDLIGGLAGRVKTEDQMNRLSKVIEDNKDNSDVQTIRERALDQIAASKAWTGKYGEAIKDIIAITTTTPTTTPTTTTPSTTTGSSCKIMISHFSIVLMLIILKLWQF